MQESHGRAGVRNGSLNFRSLCSALGCGWLTGDTWDLPANVVVSEMIREPTNSRRSSSSVHRLLGFSSRDVCGLKSQHRSWGQMSWSRAFASIKLALKKLLKEQCYKNQERRSVFRLGC